MGEFELLAKVRERLPSPGPRVRVGSGDDAAVTVPGGATATSVDALVEAFYAKVRQDDLIGPVFERAIGDHWDAHLAKLKDFWSSVMLQTGRFRGAPMAAHLALGEIGPAHFCRWLALFHETATEVCPPAPAAAFIACSNMIAQSFQLGLAAARGDLPRTFDGGFAAGLPCLCGGGSGSGDAGPSWGGASRRGARSATFISDLRLPPAIR